MQKVIYFFIFLFSLNLSLLSQSAEDLFQDAVELYNDDYNRQSTKIIQLLNKSLDLGGNFIESHFMLATSYDALIFKNTYFKEVEYHYNTCIQLIEQGNKLKTITKYNERNIYWNAAFSFATNLYVKDKVYCLTKAINLYIKALNYPFIPDQGEVRDPSLSLSDYGINYRLGETYSLLASYEKRNKNYYSAIDALNQSIIYFKNINNEDEINNCNEEISINRLLSQYSSWQVFYAPFFGKLSFIELKDSKKFLYFYNKSNIEIISKNIIRLWIMSISVKDKNSYSYSTKYEDKSFVEFDLKNNKSKLLKFISYDKSNNILENHQPDNSKWEYIAPETIYESIVENLKKILKEKK